MCLSSEAPMEPSGLATHVGQCCFSQLAVPVVLEIDPRKPYFESAVLVPCQICIACLGHNIAVEDRAIGRIGIVFIVFAGSHQA